MMLLAQFHRVSVAVIVATLLGGCATTYEFTSVPPDATVFQNVNGERALLGQTPLIFKKSALPDDRPFSVTFVRDGWESVDVLITPTGDSRTKVNATLRPGRGDGKDPQTLRTRKVLGIVFNIQELVAQNKVVDALSLLRDLEKDEPNLAEVFVLKGSVYAAINDRAQAKTAWERALALDSSLDRVRVELRRLSEAAGTRESP